MIEVSKGPFYFFLWIPIENAQFMEWNKLTPKVMEAAGQKRGNSCPDDVYAAVTIYLKEVPEMPPGTTWQDMLADETVFAVPLDEDRILSVPATGELQTLMKRNPVFGGSTAECVKAVVRGENQNGVLRVSGLSEEIRR